MKINNNCIESEEQAVQNIKDAINFASPLLGVIFVKRFVCYILLSAGMSVADVVKLTGVAEHTVRNYSKKVKKKSI